MLFVDRGSTDIVAGWLTMSGSCGDEWHRGIDSRSSESAQSYRGCAEQPLGLADSARHGTVGVAESRTLRVLAREEQAAGHGCAEQVKVRIGRATGHMRIGTRRVGVSCPSGHGDRRGVGK